MTRESVEALRDRMAAATIVYSDYASVQGKVPDAAVIEAVCLSSVLLSELLLAVMDIGRALHQEIAEMRADELLHHESEMSK